MKRKEYWINTEKTSEKLMRNYFLDNSNKISLDMIEKEELDFFRFKKNKLGGYNDPKFIKTLNILKKDFIKKFTDNKIYNIKQKGKHEHCLYRLSKNVKNLLNKETLFFNSSGNIDAIKDTKYLYGFEDPIFYKNDEIIGGIISHESMVFIYLNEDEKEKLEMKGIILYK